MARPVCLPPLCIPRRVLPTSHLLVWAALVALYYAYPARCALRRLSPRPANSARPEARVLSCRPSTSGLSSLVCDGCGCACALVGPVVGYVGARETS
eukprot:2792925-Pyramimonas_sp.AAC.1